MRNASAGTELKGHYYWGSKPVAFYTTANDGTAARFDSEACSAGALSGFSGASGGVGEEDNIPCADALRSAAPLLQICH